MSTKSSLNINGVFIVQQIAVELICDVFWQIPQLIKRRRWRSPLQSQPTGRKARVLLHNQLPIRNEEVNLVSDAVGQMSAGNVIRGLLETNQHTQITSILVT